MEQVGKFGCKLFYEFKTKSNDIGLIIEFQPINSKNKSVLKEMKRYDADKSLISNIIQITEPGTIYLTFDNSFSRFTSKTVLYRVNTEENQENSDDLQGDLQSFTIHDEEKAINEEDAATPAIKSPPVSTATLQSETPIRAQTH